jgi:hypothetical protein
VGTRSVRRVRDGLIVLCALALAGVAQPLPASAVPTTLPTPSSTGPASAGPVSPTPSTSTSHRTSGETYSVTVSPARLVVGEGELGRTQLLTLVNRGQAPVSLTVEKRNFVAMPDGGLNYRPDAPWGAADWVTVSPTSLNLRPGESQQVRATIDVPREPEVGDHQVALIFLAPSGGSGNVKVNRGIGAPLYVTVPGPTDDSVRLNSLTGPRWSLRGQPRLTASLTSTGTVHRDFRGPGAVSAGTPDHLSRFPDFTVVRGADRIVSTSWDAPLVCVCHPSLTITNAGQAPQTVSTRVVVAPWWLLAGLALLLAGVATVLLRRRSRADRTRDDGDGDGDDQDGLDILPARHG